MKTVVLIDDDEAFRLWAATVMTESGWQVVEADDGDIGVELAGRHVPDAIICDLLMPRCNGFMACQNLRRNPALKATRILVTSGRAFESDRQAALEAGADGFLAKPIQAQELLEWLEQTKPIAGAKIRPDAPVPDGTVAMPPGATNSRLPQAAAASSGEITSQENGEMRVRFWGVRGSIPTPGATTVRFGGNTSCVEVRAEGQVLILDAGTGLRLLGQELMREFAHRPLEMTLLLTHTHWDHIQGLPFFLPLLKPQFQLRILGYEGARQGLDNVLTSQMESPFFPIGMRQLSANVRIEELKELEFAVGRLRVQAAFANHPGICVGYRINSSRASIAFFPDNEPHLGRERWPQAGGAALDHARREHERLTAFLRGTDLLIMDAQYDATEYLDHAGWGHGCVDDVVRLAMDAGVKQLSLFHHDPDHGDEKVDDMVRKARELAGQSGSSLTVEAAQEGRVVNL